MSTTSTTTTTETQQVPQIQAQRNDDSTFIPRGTVTANLSFYNPPSDGSKPFNYVEQAPPGQPQRNYSDITQPVEIHDLRDHPSSNNKSFVPNLDTNAFAALRVPPAPHSPSSTESASTPVDFTSDDSIQKHYYPQVSSLLLSSIPGSPHRVLIFDHTIRRADPSAPRAPVQRVHIDQTPSSAIARVRRHISNPTEAETLLKGRVRIINVWRPLNGPVQSFPLAFADSESTTNDAVVPVEHRYPTHTGETAAIRYTPTQKWWYLSGIENEERVLLQCFDSEGTGARVPHSAFVDPRTPEGARGRESIEVRALVFG